MPYSGPEAPPTLRIRVVATDVSTSAGCCGCAVVERCERGVKPARHVLAVVGVADGGVELGEVVPVLGDDGAEPAHDGDEVLRGEIEDLLMRCSHAPAQRGVCTGASHSRIISSSSRSRRDRACPAISRQVM